ncbi:hypothetical protein MELB17_05594 [Marinobacter sp. ELB17]|nr:hypothetical protein MELB17_05594 [Marinobacter sp. ELB17]
MAGVVVINPNGASAPGKRDQPNKMAGKPVTNQGKNANSTHATIIKATNGITALYIRAQEAPIFLQSICLKQEATSQPLLTGQGSLNGAVHCMYSKYNV